MVPEPSCVEGKVPFHFVIHICCSNIGVRVDCFNLFASASAFAWARMSSACLPADSFIPRAALIPRPIPAALSGTGQKATGALNLREFYNTALLVDMSPLPTGATIGPVGSDFNGTVWPTTPLTAIVEMNVEHKADGSVAYWFSSPNPGRCAT